MGHASRRELLAGLGAAALTSVFTRNASATIVKSLSLPALVRASSRIVVLTPLGAESHYEEIGRKRRIVTDTRVRVEEHIAKEPSPRAELFVRSLGGRVGHAYERVHGQARLSSGVPCLTFLLQGPDGLHYVMGMAQGHYPIVGERAPRLIGSPGLPEILDYLSSAARELVGQGLSEATRRVRERTACCPGDLRSKLA